MSVRRWILVAAVVPVAGLIAWFALLPDDWRAWLGFSDQATQNYAFVSGVGPMLLTAIGMSTIIAGLWHSLNCHEEGCFRIGRHKVRGTPWCNGHHDKARTVLTMEDRLDGLTVQIGLLVELLAAQHAEQAPG